MLQAMLGNSFCSTLGFKKALWGKEKKKLSKLIILPFRRQRQKESFYKVSSRSARITKQNTVTNKQTNKQRHVMQLVSIRSACTRPGLELHL